MRKNKLILWIVMQIMLYLIKTNDNLILSGMEESILNVIGCIVVSVGSIAILYNTLSDIKEVVKTLNLIEIKCEDIIAKDEPIKPSEYKVLNEKLEEAVYVINKKVGLTFLFVIVITVSIYIGVENFNEYRKHVEIYRKWNGIWNDGKIPEVKEWRECGNQ